MGFLKGVVLLWMFTFLLVEGYEEYDNCPREWVQITMTPREENHIISPKFPFHYNNSMDCKWRIYTPPNHRIGYLFALFSLAGNSENCTADYVGISEDQDSWKRFCGRDIPKPNMTVGNVLYLNFVTDEKDTDNGFVLFLFMDKIPRTDGKPGNTSANPSFTMTWQILTVITASFFCGAILVFTLNVMNRRRAQNRRRTNVPSVHFVVTNPSTPWHVEAGKTTDIEYHTPDDKDEIAETLKDLDESIDFHFIKRRSQDSTQSQPSSSAASASVSNTEQAMDGFDEPDRHVVHESGSDYQEKKDDSQDSTDYLDHQPKPGTSKQLDDEYEQQIPLKSYALRPSYDAAMKAAYCFDQSRGMSSAESSIPQKDDLAAKGPQVAVLDSNSNADSMPSRENDSYQSSETITTDSGKITHF